MSTVAVQRIENAFVAAAIVVVFLVGGFPWWALLALFLVFDLSMAGYLHGNRAGAFTYNLVHNYTGPAVLAGAYALGVGADRDLWVVGLVAGCWGFHVAVDRALGYGLKCSEGFQHTHLGVIGKVRPAPEQ